MKEFNDAILIQGNFDYYGLNDLLEEQENGWSYIKCNESLLDESERKIWEDVKSGRKKVISWELKEKSTLRNAKRNQHIYILYKNIPDLSPTRILMEAKVLLTPKSNDQLIYTYKDNEVVEKLSINKEKDEDPRNKNYVLLDCDSIKVISNTNNKDINEKLFLNASEYNKSIFDCRESRRLRGKDYECIKAIFSDKNNYRCLNQNIEEIFKAFCFVQECGIQNRQTHDEKQVSFNGKNGLYYTEGHHFLPRCLISKSDLTSTEKLKTDIDDYDDKSKLHEIIYSDDNLLKLCSVCHNKLHYGLPEESLSLIGKIYDKKNKETLMNAYRLYFKLNNSHEILEPIDNANDIEVKDIICNWIYAKYSNKRDNYFLESNKK